MSGNSRGSETDYLRPADSISGGDPHQPDRRRRRLIGSSSDSPLEGTGFAPSVPPDRSSGGTYPANNRSDAPKLFSSGARRQLRALESNRRHCRIRLHRSRTLVISVPFRRKRPASTQVGLGVRIRFPPAGSLRTHGSNPAPSSGESTAKLPPNRFEYGSISAAVRRGYCWRAAQPRL
jgi:hypothetical protein